MFTLESMGVNELVTVRQCVGDLSNAESVNDLMCLRHSRQQRIIISKKKNLKFSHKTLFCYIFDMLNTYK